MSYEIMKSVNLRNDHIFEIVSASSNLYTSRNGKNCRSFSKWYCEYFRDLCLKSKEHVKLLFDLYNVFNGTVFYPANWKERQLIADHYIADAGYSLDQLNKDLEDRAALIDRLDDMQKYVDQYRSEKKEYIVEIDRVYVKQMAKRKLYTTNLRDQALVFKMHLRDLTPKFDGYTALHSVKFVEK